MKKLMTFLLISIMLFQLCSTAFSASDSSSASQIEYASDILSGLGIYTASGAASAVMSRIDFTRALSSVIDREHILTYGENEVAGISDVSGADRQYVALALQKGLVSKPSDGRFRPDEAADLSFAVYAFVRLAGYDAGLRNDEYLVKANELGILKGVDASAGVTGGDFILMLYNYLELYYVEHTGYDNNGNYNVRVTDQTVLEGVFRIQKFEARLIASSYSDMTATAKLPDGSMSLQLKKGGVIEEYPCNYEFDPELMGRNVTVFYDTVEETVIFMKLNKGDKCLLDIPRSEFSYFDPSVRKIYYKQMVSGSRWEQSYKERSISVPLNADIIYNGQFTLDHDFVYRVLCGEESLNIGRIRLYDIDNDSRADLMRVDAYRNVVVKSVNTYDEAIVDQLSGEVAELHVTDSDFKVTIEDSTGQTMRLSDIKKDDVVSIFTGKGESPMIRAIVSRRAENDSAISADQKNESIKTESDTYFLSRELRESSFTIELGKEYRFLFDAMGSIAAVQESGLIYANIGSVVSITHDLFSDCEIKIFTAEGEFVTYKTSKKLKVGNSKVSQSGDNWTYIDEETGNREDFDERISKGIILFDLTVDNEIKRIMIPNTNGSGLSFSSGMKNAEDVFQNPENHVLRYKTNGRYFIPTGSVLKSFVTLKSDTRIMTVPADTITSERENYYQIDSSLKNDAEVAVVGYSFGADAIRSDLLVIVSSGSVSIDKSQYYVVSEKSISLNSYGDPALTLKCMDSSGAVTEFVAGGTEVSECDVQTGVIKNYNASVAVGDVIKVALDSYGELSAIGKAYEYETGEALSLNPSYWYASKRFVYASVYDIDGDALSYVLGDTIDEGTDLTAKLQIAGLGKTKAIIVKPMGNTVSVEFSDISSATSYKDSKTRYSGVILHGGYGEMSFIVFYLKK